MSSHESANVAAPVNASPVAPKVNKGKPTPAAPTVSPLVAALTKALAQAEKAKPAKVFDEQAFRKDLAKHGLPAAFIESATKESAKKWASEHGDNGEAQTRALLSIIAPSLGGLDSIATVSAKMAKEEKEKGKVVATAKEFKDALTGEKDARAELRTIAEKAADMRKGGKAWSEIETALKLSENTRQALYMASQDFPELFPVAKK